MGYFDVNIATLVKLRTAVRWRQAVFLAWVKALVKPAVDLQGTFTTAMTNFNYQVAHNGQVCFLQAALNDTFDNSLRRIYISNPAWEDPEYLYLDDEDKPEYLYLDSEDEPVYLYLDTEVYTGSGPSFIVNVPSALSFNTAQMEALINYYKLPARSYSIVMF